MELPESFGVPLPRGGVGGLFGVPCGYSFWESRFLAFLRASSSLAWEGGFGSRGGPGFGVFIFVLPE